MPDNLTYMYGKLSQAVEVLITNQGDVKNRVWVAETYLSMIQTGGLPTSLHEDVDWIHHMLTRYPPDRYYKSALDATYRRTRNVTAQKIAQRIWKLYHLMQDEIEARK